MRGRYGLSTPVAVLVLCGVSLLRVVSLYTGVHGAVLVPESIKPWDHRWNSRGR